MTDAIGADGCWPRLLADIGGTHARFALETAPHCLTELAVLACKDYRSLAEALHEYLQSMGQPKIRHAAMAVATPIGSDWVQLTNHSWAFSIEATRQAFGLETLLVLNDFTAQALAVMVVAEEDLVQIGGTAPLPNSPKAVLGAGTGLGVSGLIPTQNGVVALAGEGGHVSFAPFDEVEIAIWQDAKRQYGHVSAERLLSGSGLSLIYATLAKQVGLSASVLSAAEISAAAVSGSSALCADALDRFCAILGTVAADLALTLGAHGGVYVAGGMVPRFVDYFKQSSFRARFENKGRFGAYLAPIPVYVVCSPDSGIRGAVVALARHFDARARC